MVEKTITTDLPLCPQVGDGRIWDGSKWLETAPSMETYAVVALSHEIERLKKLLDEANVRY